jgi:hypothetical protein
VIVKSRVDAGPNSTFGKRVFDGDLGKIRPLTVDGLRIGDAKLIHVSYSDDGSHVYLTYSLEVQA